MNQLERKRMNQHEENEDKNESAEEDKDELAEENEDKNELAGEDKDELAEESDRHLLLYVSSLQHLGELLEGDQVVLV